MYNNSFFYIAYLPTDTEISISIYPNGKLKYIDKGLKTDPNNDVV